MGGGWHGNCRRGRPAGRPYSGHSEKPEGKLLRITGIVPRQEGASGRTPLPMSMLARLLTALRASRPTATGA